MSPLLVPVWICLGCATLMIVTLAQTTPGFYPSRILLSGTHATSFLVNTSSVSLHLTVITNTTVVTTPGCSGSDRTSDWFLTLEPIITNLNKITLNLNRTLCSTNEPNCCTESLCIVETLQVSACENGNSVASLLIQAEIYVNNTSTAPVSDNATVIPTQAYQPLGSCPCNLTAGACDIGCCCDQECNSNMTSLFNGFCYTGVFGGNVTPMFDQLCSFQAQNQVPDWFPFLCVTSSMDNSPFLGYFYQGSTVSPSQQATFSVTYQSIPDGSNTGYKQGNAILKDQNGYNEYFKIPQKSTIGVCERNAPVAYLQNFNVACVHNLTTCSSALTTDLNQRVNDGSGGTIIVNVQSQNINSVGNYITFSGIALPQSMVCTDIILSADYTFVWEANKLREINVTVITANFTLDQQAQLTQRFTAIFLTSTSASAVLSGNPGYLVGKPVLAANGTSPLVRSAISLLKPVGDGSCSSASNTPLLFGQDSFSGCRLKVNTTCTLLREIVTVLLKSLVPADYIAMRGNSNLSDLSEWVPIINEDASTPCTDCTAAKVKCLGIPANMNIQIMTAVTGTIEGVPQEEILAAKISFSTVNADCINDCNLSLPISTSVQFIKVPAQTPPRITRFQMNYTEYDCERNDICWQQLAYPLTKYYTGEPHHLTLAKGMILVFFFIVAAVLGGPWNRIRKAWNNKL
ncbi:tectonic-2 [Discoglossus pictus]